MENKISEILKKIPRTTVLDCKKELVERDDP